MTFQKASFPVAAFQLKQSGPKVDWSYVAKRKKKVQQFHLLNQFLYDNLNTLFHLPNPNNSKKI
jgi:hypothetical protein